MILIGGIRVANLAPGSLKVTPFQGEPTSFLVESATAECTVCHRHYKRWNLGYDPSTGFDILIDRPGRNIGDDCPYRGGCPGVLTRRPPHKVDISGWRCHGSCACELFQFTLGPLLSRTHPDTWIEGKFACPHIRQANHYSHRLTLLHHINGQMKPYARGRQEMDDSPQLPPQRGREYVLNNRKFNQQMP